MSALDLLALAAALVVGAPCWILVVECLAAQLPSRPTRRGGSGPWGPRPRAACLVPAHDEEELLPATLDSVGPELAPGDRLVVVAHNCTDGTAAVARERGAEVVVVRDGGEGGKPAALAAGLVALDADPPDVVVVVDADCRVAPGSFETLVRAVQRTGGPVQARYAFAPAADAESSISSLALLVKNVVRPLGLARLGLPCLLNGAGSGYPFAALREAPQGEGSIAEDYQLALDLARRGRAPRFCPEARVESTLPGARAGAWRQRRRWEHGHLSLVARVPLLVLEALRTRRPALLVLALELSVPPLSLLLLLGLLAALLGAFAAAATGHGLPLLVVLGSGAAAGGAVLLACLRFAGAGVTLRALARVPGYVLWKVPLYLAYARDREKRWTRTPRDREAA